MDKRVILKPQKEKAIKNRHHWIFSGAVQKYPEFLDGDILPVFSSRDEFLGQAYFNRKCSIVGRMLVFDDTDPFLEIRNNIEKAVRFRKGWFKGKDTNAYRLIHGEGDSLPGLVVDQYDATLVVQIATLGMEKLKEKVIEILLALLKPKTIYEKSDIPSRREEGLKSFSGILHGKLEEPVEITENGLKFLVNISEGQKTGFFLDQREMRVLVRDLSKGKRVLNCFGYTGGFSVYALQGGAKTADTVEISEKAIALAKENVKLNGYDAKKQGFFAEDVFRFLRENPLQYDLIILDPPAFAKKKSDIDAACRGYKDINYQALKKMPSGSLLLTSSCSNAVDEKLFQTVVFQAASDAKRSVKIIGRHHLAPDHPINIFHPEGEYLKSLVLRVE